ncbi:hypothetical protein ACJX0J_041644, partial [Zea mays]
CSTSGISDSLTHPFIKGRFIQDNFMLVLEKLGFGPVILDLFGDASGSIQLIKSRIADLAPHVFSLIDLRILHQRKSEKHIHLHLKFVGGQLNPSWSLSWLAHYNPDAVLVSLGNRNLMQ